MFRKTARLAFLLAVVAGCLTGASAAPLDPRTMSPEDMAEFCHLSEGADVYPFDWMVALKSVASKRKSTFLAGLDQRYGLIASPAQGQHLVPWVGLTAAWSSAHPTRAEALGSDVLVRSRDEDGKKSIKMVGTNCALRHSAEVTFGGQRAFLPGAPAIANVRGFFRDLGQSTLATLADRGALEEFLEAQGVADARQKSAELNGFFLKRLGEDTGHLPLIDISKFAFLARISAKHTLIVAKFFDDQDRLHKGQHAIAETLEKLLRVTYGFTDTDDIGELKPRMEFLARLFTGNAPGVHETESGFGRTDAFGRISNMVLRGDKQIDYTAPVSFPWMWGMRHVAEMHYDANTNSILARNIGQSLGLGSILLDDKGKSTTNLHHLARLEELAYRVTVPDWRTTFAGNASMNVDESLAERGKPIFEKHCAGCHTAVAHVGPQSNLLEYKLFRPEVLKTDPNYVQNIVTPVPSGPMGQAMIALTLSVKDAYYARYSVPADDQARWEDKARRGQDFFRDTFLGFTGASALGNDYGDIKPGLGHRARHLSGVWATAPYLHNGSVPSIAALLKLEPRPDKFTVRSHEYDPKVLGYVSTLAGAQAGDVYDTSLQGNSNQGHDFATDLSPEDKQAILEYLKVLPPEPELANP